jgi:hypothetical protein
MRSNTGVSYPYNLPTFVNLIGSNQGPTVYYYFYDWKLEKPSVVCTSPRTTVTANVTTATGVSAADAAGNVMIYPNPAGNEQVFVQFSQVAGETVIELTDLSGRLISANRLSVNSAGQRVAFDTNNLAAGTYLIRVQSEAGSFNQKLVVNK